jgi:hypothetical protein
MRCVLIAALLSLLAGCGKSLSPEAEAAFQKAQKAFESAKTPNDYLLAASLFQKVLDQGTESGAVFYNLGNAYMRGGQRGRAIACYRQAKRYLPRDGRLEANLQYALSNSATPSSGALMEYVFFWQDWLSYPEKFQLSLLIAAMTFALGLGGLFSSQPWWRRAAAITLMITVILGCSALFDLYRFTQIRHGVVTRPEVIVRKGNAESYEPALTAPLGEGVEFRVIDSHGDWLLVRLPAGQEGWLKAADVVTY